MKFNNQKNVYNAEGDKVGEVDRVVIDPDTSEVTHLIVKKGFLFTEDKVVSMDLVGPMTDEGVTLKEDAGNLDGFPSYKEAHYMPAGGMLPEDEGAPRPYPIIYYPPFNASAQGGPRISTLPVYVEDDEMNIPEGTVAIGEGTDVVSSDGNHVGSVARVFTDPGDHRATHLLISEGLLLKERKLVPTLWISEVADDEIHLSVRAELLEKLPEYQE